MRASNPDSPCALNYWRGWYDQADEPRHFPAAWGPVAMTIRRLKTYTGNTGYVYQYYFVGKRPGIAPQGDPPTTEYVFDVTSDRKTTYSISVFLSQAVAEEWATAHGRSLTEAEQYAAVKMRLFQAFDEHDNLSKQGRTLVIDSIALETALNTLGVD